MIIKIDRKRVILAFLRWQVAMELFLLLLHDNFHLNKTVKDSQFWWLTLMIIILGLLFDIWQITHEKIEFIGTKIVHYSESKKEVDLTQISEVKELKTIFSDNLSLEYKNPQGNIHRMLIQYNYYSVAALKRIVSEIIKINPEIRLDNITRLILDGKFKNKL